MNSPLPREITLKASSLKWFLMLLATALFTAAGIWMLSDPENTLVAWLTLFLFGVIGIPVSLFQLVRPGRLTLNEDGFEQIMMGRVISSDWKAVSGFGVLRIGRNKFVSFSRMEDEGKKMTNLSRALTGGGHSGMLGDNFGMKAPELADLMNAFRNRALNS